MRIALTRTFMFVIVVFLFSGVAMAQKSTYRQEVFGIAGVAESLETLSSVTTYLNIGGGFGFRPFSADRSRLLRMLGGEFEVNTTPTSSGNVTYFTGNVVLHASLASAEPYFVAGGGTAAHNGGHRAMNGGFGVKLPLAPHISLRPEVRVFYADDVSGFLRISVGAGYRW